MFLKLQNEKADSEVAENIITVRNNCATITASSSGPHTTISLIKPASPSYIPISQTNASNDRPPVAHSTLYGKLHYYFYYVCHVLIFRNLAKKKYHCQKNY